MENELPTKEVVDGKRCLVATVNYFLWFVIRKHNCLVYDVLSDSYGLLLYSRAYYYSSDNKRGKEKTRGTFICLNSFKDCFNSVTKAIWIKL